MLHSVVPPADSAQNDLGVRHNRSVRFFANKVLFALSSSGRSNVEVHGLRSYRHSSIPQERQPVRLCGSDDGFAG